MRIRCRRELLLDCHKIACLSFMNVLHLRILSNLWHTFSFGTKSEDNVVYYLSWGQIIIFVKENNSIKLKLVTPLHKGDNDIVCRKTGWKWVKLCNLNHMNRLSLTKGNDIIQNIMERGKLKHSIASWTCLWDSWIFCLLSTYFLREKKVSTQGGIKPSWK